MDKNDPRRQPTDDELDELNEHWHDPGDPDGVIAAEERQKWQQQYPPAPVTTKKPRRKRRWLVVLVLLILLPAATAGAYWFGNWEAGKSTPKPITTPKTAAPKQAQQPVVAPTTHYDSVAYNVGFDYPKTWKMTDTSAKLAVASPTMEFVTTTGEKVNAHLLLTVRHKQTVLSEFADGSAKAALDSQKITYKQPTPAQRAQSYISFLNYAASPLGGFDAVYITGDNGYLQAQAIPMAEVVGEDPLINITFVSCPTEDCASGTIASHNVATSVWKTDAVSKPVIALLQSLTLN